MESRLMAVLARIGRNRLFDVAAIVLAVIGAMRLTAALPGRALKNDFAHYYLASEALRAGQPPYATDLGPLYAKYGFQRAPELARVIAPNPPLFLWLFAP